MFNFNLRKKIKAISTRDAGLLIAGLLICIYAVVVLLFVSSRPDIGIHCAFSSIIKSVDSREFESGESVRWPQPGDRLLQVGPYYIEQTGDKEQQPWLTQVFLQKFLSSIKESPAIDASTVRHDPATQAIQVLVRFQSSEDQSVHKLWCGVGSMAIEELGPSILWFALKLGLFVVGALVLWKKPDDGFSVQFFLLCIVTVGAYMGGYHWARIATQPMLLLTFIICSVLLPPVSLLFYLVFPRPKQFFVRYRQSSLLTIFGPPLVFLVAILVSYLHVRGAVRGGLLEPPGLAGSRAATEATTSAWHVLRLLVTAYLSLAAIWYLASVSALIHSYWKATDTSERNQVKWILYGALLAILPIGYTLYLVHFATDEFGMGAGTWPMFAASAFLTIAYAVSITRYRLMQLDQIVSSGAVYFLISFLAGLVYYGVVFAGVLAADIVGSRVVPGPSIPQTVWVSASFLVLMLILDFARSRFMRALDRRFYRDKHQLDRTLRRMGQAIEQLVDPPTLARRLLQASADILNASWGAVYLRADDPTVYRLAGDLGATPALTDLPPGCPLVEVLKRRGFISTTTVPDSELEPAQRQLRFLGGEVAHALAHEGQFLALLILGPKVIGRYSADDMNLLAAFSQLTALALESAERHCTIEQMNCELKDKVEKIAEQQRRILALQSQLTRQAARDPVPPAPKETDRPEASDAGASATAARNHADGFIGSSSSVQNLLELVRKASATQSAVLIRGESGTGKGVLSRLLHQNSARAAKPFVEVHCAALSTALLESEIFGHVKGAFTGAHRDKVGRFELANGGTMFLDEIGDISLEVQTKLLRVLQEKRFERVGSSDPIQVDVRIIAATHQNLEQLIRQGRFREDLYFRIKVIDIHVPPLRDRREDIPELALHFLHVYAQQCGKPVSSIDDDAMAMLKSFRWRGNIRELENVMESAVVMADDTSVTLKELPAEMHQLCSIDDETNAAIMPEAIEPANDGPLGIQAERAERNRRERDRLVRALATAQGNKASAARILGLSRSTFISRLKKHNLS